MKEFEARHNENFRDNPVHNKLREEAGTDWENKGYGNSDDDESHEEIKRDEDRLDDENEEN